MSRASIAELEKAFNEDEARDAHGQWTSSGGSSSQVAAGEAQHLHDVVDQSEIGDLAQAVADAHSELKDVMEQTAEAEDSGDENAGERQSELHDKAVELHAHIKALAERSAEVQSMYERHLVSIGVGRRK